MVKTKGFRFQVLGFKFKSKFIKTLCIHAIINSCTQSSLKLIEAGRKSKKNAIIRLKHNNKVIKINKTENTYISKCVNETRYE